VDAEAAARRWVDVWSRGWPAHDVEPIAALYAPTCNFVSHPLRGPEDARAYVERAFAEEDETECRFGEPRVDGDRASVEYWAHIRSEGTWQTLAGVTLLRFDAGGLVVEHRDYWALEDGRADPPPGWGDYS
jgi:ketosteroid isomerase-like protein